jgi:hypothetical protein
VNTKYQPRTVESAIITDQKKAGTPRKVPVNGLNLHFLGELTANLRDMDANNYYQRSQQPKQQYIIETIDWSFVKFSIKILAEYNLTCKMSVSTLELLDVSGCGCVKHIQL